MLKPSSAVVPYKWEMLALLWVAFFLNQADRQVYSVVLKSIQEELLLSDAQLGLVASILFWTLALVFPVAGYLGDILSKRWIVTCSLLFWSVATLCTGLSRTVTHLVLLRSIATGGGEAFYGPSAFALIAGFHKKTRALAISIHQTAVYAGFVLSGVIGGYVSSIWGWRSAFYVFGSFGILAGLLLLVRLRDAPKEPSEKTAEGIEKTPATVTPRETLAVLLRTPTALLLIVAYTGMIFVHVGYMTWGPMFLQDRFHFSPLQAGFSSMFYFQAMAFVGVLVGGFFSDRWFPIRHTVRMEIQILGLGVASPFIVLLGLGNTPLWVYLGLAGFGLFRGIYDSNTFAALFDVIPPRYHSSASGIMNTVGFLLGASSPVLIGWFKPTVGLSYGLASLSLVHLIAAAAILWARRSFFRRDYDKERLGEQFA
ncbi:MAG: MFS transporter [Thermoguttaceae bacterium]|jgi:sugar phosphate permease